MLDQGRRQEFITSAGGAAAWPLAARAQQADRMRRIGVLMSFAESDPESPARLTAFVHSLQQSGWIDGRNVRIEGRWGAGDAERIRNMGENFESHKPVHETTTGSCTGGNATKWDSHLRGLFCRMRHG
jgi:putative ABC transport system substrate-binding protein